MQQRFVITALLALLLTQTTLVARTAHEQARIDYLLRHVEEAQGVRFIRNGKEYDGRAGAKHLRRKLDYAGERVKTAEDFVKYCASESSSSGRKYRIHLQNGATIDAARYFASELRKFDQKR